MDEAARLKQIEIDSLKAAEEQKKKELEANQEEKKRVELEAMEAAKKVEAEAEAAKKAKIDEENRIAKEKQEAEQAEKRRIAEEKALAVEQEKLKLQASKEERTKTAKEISGSISAEKKLADAQLAKEKEAQVQKMKEAEIALAKKNAEEEAKRKKDAANKLSQTEFKQYTKKEVPVINNNDTPKNRAAAEAESKKIANDELRYKALEEAEKARIAREEDAALKRKQVREKMKENAAAIEDFRKKNEQELAAKQQQQIEAQRKAMETRNGNAASANAKTNEPVKRKSFSSEGNSIDKKLATSNSVDSLLKSYPEGVTVEELETGNCKIYRLIYIKDGQATEYKKITYKWGVFYKKNNKDITESMFKNETKNLKN
jgi:colicin import membrane protein